MVDGTRIADAVGHAPSGRKWRRERAGLFPPLTPALSPLRGEGERFRAFECRASCALLRKCPSINNNLRDLIIGNWSFFGHWALVIGHYYFPPQFLPRSSGTIRRRA